MTERPHSDWEVDLLLEDNLRLREQVKAAAAGPWQPGETAPKDGSKILGIWDGWLLIGAWVIHSSVSAPDGGYWEFTIPTEYDTRSDAPFRWAPIHLPEATK
jgi:hypothetical protein